MGEQVADGLRTLARAEGLEAHARSVEVRLGHRSSQNSVTHLSRLVGQVSNLPRVINPRAERYQPACSARPSLCLASLNQWIIGAQDLTADRLGSPAPAIATLARAEQLKAHARSVEVRLG